MPLSGAFHLECLARWPVTSELDGLHAEIERLRAALEIIAGRRQCVDNTLGNVLIARDALDYTVEQIGD